MAKHLKKLKARQKQLLTANGYDYKEYQQERDDEEKIVYVNIDTGDKLYFIKSEGVFKC